MCGYIVAFTKVLTMYQIYQIGIHPLHCSALSPPIPGRVSAGIIFASTYMCSQNLNRPHPPTPFPVTFPLPLVPTRPLSPRQDLFRLLFSDFIEEKKIKRKT
jgi:hypothetical protein